MIESELREHAFLIGDDYSAADICLYGYVHCAEDGGFNLERYGCVGPTFPPRIGGGRVA